MKLKKTIFLLILLSCSTSLIYQIIKKVNKKEKIKIEIKTLPKLNFKAFNNLDYDINKQDNKKLLIIYFDPSCDFCQEKAKEFYENRDSISHFNIFMVTTNKDLSKTYLFYNSFKLKEIKGLHIGIDSTNEFYSSFNTLIVPSYFFYDEKHKLIKSINGSVLIQTVLNILK